MSLQSHGETDIKASKLHDYNCDKMKEKFKGYTYLTDGLYLVFGVREMTFNLRSKR